MHDVEPDGVANNGPHDLKPNLEPNLEPVDVDSNNEPDDVDSNVEPVDVDSNDEPDDLKPDLEPVDVEPYDAQPHRLSHNVSVARADRSAVPGAERRAHVLVHHVLAVVVAYRDAVFVPHDRVADE